MNADMARPYLHIWRLTWPQLLMMVFNFLIGVADVYVCGRIGREAQAAMGLVSQALFFFLTVANAVSTGAVAALSQSLGAGKLARARRYAGLCLTAGAVGGVLILAGGLAFQELFLRLLNVPQAMAGQTGDILRVFLLLLPVNSLFLISNAVLRAHRMVMAPLYSMGLAALVNFWLDMGLGLGLWGMPELGYMGVAWATFWSVSGALTLNAWLMWRAGLVRPDMIPPWRWVRAAWRYMFNVAAPSGMMQVVWHTGYLVLLAVIGGLPSGGVEALAGFAAGARIESGVFLPAFAFNLSASILVGHDLGRGDPAEAKRTGYRVWGLGVVLMSLSSLLLWPFLPDLAALFAPDSVVAGITVDYLRYNLLAIPFTCTSMILAGALTGAGATMYTLVVFAASIWCVRLPVAWWLGWKAWGDADGVWLAMLVSQAFQASALLGTYHFKDWARFSMIKSRSLS